MASHCALEVDWMFRSIKLFAHLRGTVGLPFSFTWVFRRLCRCLGRHPGDLPQRWHRVRWHPRRPDCQGRWLRQHYLWQHYQHYLRHQRSRWLQGLLPNTAAAARCFTAAWVGSTAARTCCSQAATLKKDNQLTADRRSICSQTHAPKILSRL